jgi:predicted chitinase
MRIKDIINEAWPLAMGTAAAGFGALQTYKQSQPQTAATAAPPAPAPAPATAPTRAQPPVRPAAKPVAPQVNLEKIARVPNAQPLVRAAKQAGIAGVELAQFLAQMEHESWDFQKMVEVPTGKNYFRKYDIKHAPQQARSLGNIRPGDGERYKGRGYIQLTGRSNYKMAGDAIGLDLINQPHLAARPDIAAKIAVWYWTSRVQPGVTDFTNTRAVTQRINPGLRGLADRDANFKSYMTNI